jgi:hypothetical protein
MEYLLPGINLFDSSAVADLLLAESGQVSTIFCKKKSSPWQLHQQQWSFVH